MGFKEGEGAPETKEIETPVEDDESKVRLSDADEDDVEGEREEKVVTKESEDQPRRKNGTWAERKAERGKNRKEEAAWKVEKAEYDRRFTQMREETERQARILREEMDGLRRQGNNGQQQDPMAAQLADIERQLEQELALIEKDENRGYKQYNLLRRQEQRLITMQAIAEQNIQNARNQPQRSQYDGRVPIIEAEYPWLQDQRYAPLAKRAMAYRNYLIQVQQKPDTLDTDREALSFAQATFGPEYGLNPPPARPTQRTRDLYGGPPSRGTPNRGDEEEEIVDLGDMGRGHGLSPKVLAAAVRDGIRASRGRG